MYKKNINKLTQKNINKFIKKNINKLTQQNINKLIHKNTNIFIKKNKSVYYIVYFDLSNNNILYKQKSIKKNKKKTATTNNKKNISKKKIRGGFINYPQKMESHYEPIQPEIDTERNNSPIQDSVNNVMKQRQEQTTTLTKLQNKN